MAMDTLLGVDAYRHPWVCIVVHTLWYQRPMKTYSLDEVPGDRMTGRLLYNKASAAEQLSTSVRRIDELRRAGRLIAVQDGREYKYTHAELQRYVDSLATSM